MDRGGASQLPLGADAADGRGWFANTGFTADEAPLLHTIAYVLEGLQGVHALTGDDELLAAVTTAADVLVDEYRRTGVSPGGTGRGSPRLPRGAA